MRFGPDFARPAALCREAWEKVAGPARLPTALREAWIAANGTGDPRQEVKALAEGLRGVAWSWPWFATWQRDFDARGALPYIWESNDYRLRPERARVAILAHTLNTVLGALDRASGLPELAERRGGYRLVVIAGCPVEADVASRYAQRIEAGDLSTVPPFFPGDRTSLTVKRKT